LSRSTSQNGMTTWHIFATTWHFVT